MRIKDAMNPDLVKRKEVYYEKTIKCIHLIDVFHNFASFSVWPCKGTSGYDYRVRFLWSR